MEGTIATNSPGMSLQTHKRTERDLDIDDHNEASSANDNVSASKRFKSFAYQLNDEDCESALDVGAMLKSQSALLSEYKLNILSPVTEITKHLSHAQLHDGSAQTQQQNEDNAEVTPQKGLCSIARDSVHRFKQFQHIFNTEEISEATSTLTNFQKCQNDQQPKSESADKGKLSNIVAIIGYENISNISDFYNIDRVEYIYFQPTNYQNDIALLHLAHYYRHTDFTLEYTLGKLPMYGMKANRNRPCKIIGYGATRYAGQVQKNLIEGEVKVITNKQCRKILGNIWAPQNGENTVCAVGEQDTCQGDSGGPLICNYNGRNYIYGIVSHGLTCGIVGVPSIYTVTIPYIEWITFVVNNKIS